MIADRLPTRLWFEAGRGVARLNGHSRLLTQPPRLPKTEVCAIDYAPGEALIVQPMHEGWRDLRADEVEAVKALLVELTKGAP